MAQRALSQGCDEVMHEPKTTGSAGAEIGRGPQQMVNALLAWRDATPADDCAVTLGGPAFMVLPYKAGLGHVR